MKSACANFVAHDCCTARRCVYMLLYKGVSSTLVHRHLGLTSSITTRTESTAQCACR
jgi:hypothetical protein